MKWRKILSTFYYHGRVGVEFRGAFQEEEVAANPVKRRQENGISKRRDNLSMQLT